MKINTTFLKQMSLFSIMIGLGVGLLSSLPFIGAFIFILYFITFAGCLIVYLKKNNILGEITVKEGAIMGAIMGITSFAGFCVSFMPIAIIKGFLVNNFLGNIIINGFTNPLMFVTLLFFVVLCALLSALMNSFAGGVTAYIYEVLKNLNEEDNNKFTL
jgi:hypothetical protein